ncbi:MAG TPA: hypothetical protein VKB42_19530 [Dongiaceae bacterium]|nr:hypothetical protein [Dongiaceae bacterium]
MRSAGRLLMLAGGMALGIVAANAGGMNPFGPSGLPLTSRDFADMAKAVEPLLEDETIPIGTARSWSNAGSGNQGTITLEGRFTYDYEGKTLPCRKLRYHTVIRNYADPYNLRINRCKVANGNWMLL